MFTWLAVLISPLCNFNCGRCKAAAPIIWVVISDLFICWSLDLYFNAKKGLWSSVSVLFLLKFHFDMANFQFTKNTHGIMSGKDPYPIMHYLGIQYNTILWIFFIMETERTLSASSPAANSITSAAPPPPAPAAASPQSAGVVKSESTNFREMAYLITVSRCRVKFFHNALF